MRVKGWLGMLLALGALAAIAWGIREYLVAGPPKGKGGDPRSRRVVPVLAASVVRRDMPVHLEGLGTVAAYHTVTVKPQVDGRLERVFFVEGQVVKKGETLARIDPRPFQALVRQAEGALVRDRAQLAYARLVVEREKALTSKVIPQQQIDLSIATAKQLEGTVQMDEAALETARLNLAYTRITSPLDGVTGVRLVDPGNVVRASDPGGIVVITQLDPVAMLFTLPQDELPRIADRLRQGSLEAQALSRDGETLLGTGQVLLVDNQINQATATLRIKAIVPNPRRLLWPNQFVKARLLLSTIKGALVVPASTLQRGPSGIFVYVIGKDQRVTPRPVRAEAPRGEWAIVDHGLAEGERVVTDGQNLLRPGSRVSARESPVRLDLPRHGRNAPTEATPSGMKTAVR